MEEQEPIFKHGKICYVEIPALDIDQAITFYRKVFSWEIRTDNQGNANFDDGTGGVSGMWFKVDEPVTTSGMRVSIMVDDAQQTLDDIVAAGGSIIETFDPQSDIPIARFADPSGNAWTIYQHGSE
ncbi:VOC family protein [Mucilaginibacter terrenus]|nr:VOC family protein [Mucilaginibacter terrenus]